MSKKDPKKDVSHVEEVDLDAITGADAIFDLGKIREKAALSQDISPVSVKKEVSHNDEEHLDEAHSLPHDLEEIIAFVEDDIPPLKDEDLLLLEDDLVDFEDEEDGEDEDGEDGEGNGRKKRER